MTGHTGAEVSILFVGTRKMQSLNARYRGIDAVTDVLSFPLNDCPGGGAAELLGDIVICIPRIEKQAAAYQVTFYDELRRMLVHGLLHLVGYDHEQGDYRRRKMEMKEKEIRHALAAMD